MSLAETQQIMQMLQEIMQMLDNVDTKTKKLEADLPRTKESLVTFNELERVAVRYLALARRMGLPEGIQQQLQILAQILTASRMALSSYRMLASGTPIGLLMGFAGVLMTTDAMMNMGE